MVLQRDGRSKRHQHHFDSVVDQIICIITWCSIEEILCNTLQENILRKVQVSGGFQMALSATETKFSYTRLLLIVKF